HNLRWSQAVSVERMVMSGAAVNVPKRGAITPRISALPASADPDPVTISADSLATLPTLDLGDHWQFSAQLIKQREVDSLIDGIETLAQQEAESVDKLAGLAAVSGANVIFPNDRETAADLEAGDIFNASD